MNIFSKTLDVLSVKTTQLHGQLIFLSPVMTVASCLSEQDQSMSLLSVHMDLNGACQQRKASQSWDDMEKQEELMATGGRCFTLVRLVMQSAQLFVY